MTDHRTSRRRLATLFAALLSVLLPGLGQGFAGRPWRGIGVVIAFAAVTVLALASFLHVPSAVGIGLPVVLLLGARLWAGVDAARLTSRDVDVRWRQRLACVGFLLVAVLIVDSAGAAARHRYFGSSFRLPAGSMEPTLLEGEYFMTVPLSPADVRRGEVVAFRWLDDSRQSFVKRVVAVAGDTLAMRDGVLFLNGRAVREPYAHHTEPAIDPGGEEFDWQRAYLAGDTIPPRSYRPSRNNWGPILVPKGMYFVLGDNRDNSLDSRYRGFVSAAGVFARPYRIYFSRDLVTGRVRWRRIGIILPRLQPNTR